MDHIIESLQGIGPFLIYVALSLAMMAVFVTVYTLVTRHDELALIRRNNGAAAIAFSFSLVGYSLPLASAAMKSRSLGEFLLWAVIAIVVQVVVYWLIRFVLIRDVSQRIEAGETAAALVLGAAALAGGIVNAAAMAI